MNNYSQLSLKDKKDYWNNNPLRGDIDIKIKGVEPFKMYCDNDDTVVKELFWTDYKGWELTSLNLWCDLLKKFDGDIVYDIGAYTGIYSLIASKFLKEKEIYAFDIQKITLDRIKKNCKLNNITNINPIEAACTNFNGETKFYFSKEKEIISSAASIIRNDNEGIYNEIVQAVKLDDFNANLKDNDIGLIKIDVEDSEIEMLEGMSNILLKYAPDILIEVNMSKRLKKIKRLLPREYSIYVINEDNNSIKKVKWYSKASVYRNYLLSTRSKKGLRNLFTGSVF